MPVKTNSKEEGDRPPPTTTTDCIYTTGGGLARDNDDVSFGAEALTLLCWRTLHVQLQQSDNCLDSMCVWAKREREREGREVDREVFAEPIRLGFQKAPLKDTLFV